MPSFSELCSQLTINQLRQLWAPFHEQFPRSSDGYVSDQVQEKFVSSRYFGEEFSAATPFYVAE